MRVLSGLVSCLVTQHQGGGIYFGSGILVENLCRAILCANLFAALIFCKTNFLQETGGAKASGRRRRQASNKKQDTGRQAGLLTFNFLLCGQT